MRGDSGVAADETELDIRGSEEDGVPRGVAAEMEGRGGVVTATDKEGEALGVLAADDPEICEVSKFDIVCARRTAEIQKHSSK